MPHPPLAFLPPHPVNRGYNRCQCHNGSRSDSDDWTAVSLLTEVHPVEQLKQHLYDGKSNHKWDSKRFICRHHGNKCQSRQDDRQYKSNKMLPGALMPLEPRSV